MRTVSPIKPAVAAQLGLTLLIIPIYFIGASALRQYAPGLSLLGSPVILLGALLVASIGFHSDAPPVLIISLSLRFWNLTVLISGRAGRGERSAVSTAKTIAAQRRSDYPPRLHPRNSSN